MARIELNGNAGGLFSYLKTKHKLSTDGKLAELIGCKPSEISQIRHSKRIINEALLVRICDRTGMTLKKVQALIAYRGE